MTELEILMMAVAFSGGMLVGVMLTDIIVTRSIMKELRRRTINELVMEAEN